MKKLFVFALIALFVMGAIVSAEARNLVGGSGVSKGTNPGEIAGNGRGLVSNGHRTFRIVRFVPVTTANSTDTVYCIKLSADSIVIWDTQSFDDGVTVCTTSTTMDSRVAGVVPVETWYSISNDSGTVTTATAANTIGKQNWTWLQTYGLSQVLTTSKVSAGDALATSAYRGDAAPYKDIIGFGKPASKYGNAGFFMDASATGQAGQGRVKCFLKCE